MKPKNYIENDLLWSKATVACLGIATIGLMSIAFDNPYLLFSMGLLPNIIKSICN